MGRIGPGGEVAHAIVQLSPVVPIRAEAGRRRGDERSPELVSVAVGLGRVGCQRGVQHGVDLSRRCGQEKRNMCAASRTSECRVSEPISTSSLAPKSVRRAAPVWSSNRLGDRDVAVHDRAMMNVRQPG